MVLEAIYNYFCGEKDKIKKEQFDKWYKENYDQMRKTVTILLEGRNVPLDENWIKQLEPIPEWVDKERIKKGQKFTKDYFFVLLLVELSSVYLLLLIDNILRPLIFTNQSSTVKTAMKRYFSTTLRVLSWYETDIFDENSEGLRNLNAVNQLHLGVLEQMRSKTEEELREKCQLKNRLKEEIWSFGCPFIKKDLEEIAKRETLDPDDGLDSSNYINQYSMALTQYAFMAIMVLYPEKLGINITREEKESFIHLWRYLGYLLGIEEKYNICNGTYEEVIFKCQALSEMIFKPNLARVTPEWEHMSHAVCDGMDIIVQELVFETTVVNLLELYDFDCKEYFKSLSLWAKFKYYYYKVILSLMSFNPFREYTNKYIRAKLEAAKIKYPKINKVMSKEQ